MHPVLKRAKNREGKPEKMVSINGVLELLLIRTVTAE